MTYTLDLQFLLNTGTGYDNSERSTAIMSDGSIVHARWDVATPGTINIQRTADNGDTWDLIHTDAVSYTTGGFPYSITVDESDNIYMAWASSATQVEYKKYVKGGGWTYTSPGGNVVAFSVSSDVGRVDIEYIGSNALIVAATGRQQTTTYLYHRVRRTGGTWGTTYSKAINNLGSTGPVTNTRSGNLMIARDLAGPTGDNHRWAALVTAGDGTLTEIHAFESDRVTGDQNTTKLITANAFNSQRSTQRSAALYSIASDRWVAAQQVESSTRSRQHAVVFGWSGMVIPTTTATPSPGIAGSSNSSNSAILAFPDRLVCYWSMQYSSTITYIYGAVARIDLVANRITWSTPFRVGTTSALVRDIFHGPNRNLSLTPRLAPVIFNIWATGDAAGGRYSFFNSIPGSGPVVTKPTGGSISNTDRPMIGSSVGTAGSTPTDPRRKFKVQLSTTGGFGSNLRDFTFADTKFAYSGYIEEQVSAAAQLFQDSSWYVRLKYIDEIGNEGAYGTAINFAVSHPPTSRNLVPTGGQIVAHVDGGNTFQWTFTDTSSGDYQTAYRVVVEKADDGSTVVDTGKVVSTASSATVVIPAPNVGEMLRWNLILWDRDDVEGPASDYQLVQYNDPPTVGITTTSFANPAPLVTWNYTAGTAGTQVKSRVVIYDAARTTLVYDSGEVANALQQYQIPTPVLERGNSYDMFVMVWDGDNVEGRANTDNTPASWTGPDQPNFAVNAEYYDTLGFNVVSWDATDRDAAFYSWRAYRDNLGGDGWELIGEYFDTTGTVSVMDFLAPANNACNYAVVQVKTLSGGYVESDFDEVKSIVSIGSNYWLVDHDYQGATLDLVSTTYGSTQRLAHVTDESFNDEFEEAFISLIGRGRRKEVGTDYGVSGQLTAQLWGLSGRTPRQERLDLEDVRKLKKRVYLRNPFGDVYRVAVGQLSFERVSGVGVTELTNVTIPYSEIGA